MGLEDGRVWKVLSAAVLCFALMFQLTSPAAGRQAVTSLADAVAFAVQHNPQVAASRAAVRAAQAQVQVVRAGLAPSVNVSAGGSIGTSTGSTTTSGQVTATVTYLVFDGGLREAQIRQSEAQAEAAGQALAAGILDVALQTVQAYMAVIVGAQLVLLREQAVAQARTQLASAEANFRVGRVPRADVVRAESVLAAAEFDLVDARGQVESRRTALRTVMGLEAGPPLEVAAPVEPPPQEVSETEARQRALQRPEVRRAEADVRAGEAGLAMAMIQGGVTATVDGRYVLIGTGGSTSTPGTWSVGIGVSIPLYDGGRRAAAVEQARATLDASRAQMEGVRFQVQQEALLARLQARAAIAKVEAARRAALAAREAFSVAQGRYAAGVGTIIEVATAQTELAAAEVALVQAAADRWTTTAALRRAVAMSILP
ncbi:MAG: TolC family protein [Armatimonadetes bacterium]|nr:TolC family protein [Armatimonadota bacterium]